MTLRDVLARIEWAAEALEDGDPQIAHSVLLDLRDEPLGDDVEEPA